MNVLLVGSGGREHAIAWKLKQSKRCGKLYFAPGNGGTGSLGTNLPDLPFDPVNTKNADAIDYFCRQHDVSLVVVGPEAPLCDGLVDKLEAAGIKAFGPSADAARIEGSKGFMKDLCAKHGVATAKYRRFRDPVQARAYVAQQQGRVLLAIDLDKDNQLELGVGLTIGVYRDWFQLGVGIDDIAGVHQ